MPISKNVKSSFWLINSKAEAHLQLTWTTTMELLRGNGWKFLAVNYFCKKSSIVDIRLCSKYAWDKELQN